MNVVVQIMVIAALVFNQLLASAHGHVANDAHSKMDIQMAHVHLSLHGLESQQISNAAENDLQSGTVIKRSNHTQHSGRQHNDLHHCHGHHSHKSESTAVQDLEQHDCCDSGEACCLIVPVSSVSGQVVESYQLPPLQLNQTWSDLFCLAFFSDHDWQQVGQADAPPA